MKLVAADETRGSSRQLDRGRESGSMTMQSLGAARARSDTLDDATLVGLAGGSHGAALRCARKWPL
jgi:hypothetical protein